MHSTFAGGGGGGGSRSISAHYSTMPCLPLLSSKEILGIIVI